MTISTNMFGPDLIDKRVIVSNKEHLLYGKEGTVVGTVFYRIQVNMDGEDGVTFWDYDELTLIDTHKPNPCECGSTTVGSPFHSYYCPLHSPNPYD